MIEGLVGQFLGSSQGANILSQLGAQGLTKEKAQEAVEATAEGAVKNASVAGLDLSSLIGGTGGLGGIAGKVGGMLGGLLHGSPAATPGTPATGSPLAALTGPVSEFVAKKTGLAPTMAQSVVNVVLPKILELVQKH